MTRPAPRAPWSTRLRFPLRVAAIVLGILFAGELAARTLVRSRPNAFMADPVVQFRPRPGWAGGHVRINAEGLRDDEAAGPKAAGERRLLIIGDSLAYAKELPFEDTFGERLEQLLGPTTRCLNAAVPGYSPLHERLLLEELAPALAPDVVVLVVSLGTDLMDLCVLPRGFDDVRRRVELVGPEQRIVVHELPPRPKRFNLSKTLAEVSVLWRRIRGLGLYQQLKIGARERQPLGVDGLPLALSPEAYRLAKVKNLAPLRRGATDSPPLSDAWTRFEAELREVRLTAERVGAKVLVVGVPEDLQVDDALLHDVAARATPPVVDLPTALDLLQPQRRCREVCERVGVAWLDVLPALDAASSEKLFIDGSNHLGAAGHEVLAREVAGALARLP